MFRWQLSVNSPQSPCVSICALDQDDVCMGCFRTGEEITDWFMADDARKQEILLAAEQRRADSSVIKLL